MYCREEADYVGCLCVLFACYNMIDRASVILDGDRINKTIKIYFFHL